MYPTTLRHSHGCSLDEARAILRKSGLKHHDCSPTGSPKHMNGHGKRGAVVKALSALGFTIEGSRVVDVDGRSWGRVSKIEGGAAFQLDYILSP